MKFTKMIAMAVSCAALAACGGGDAGEENLAADTNLMTDYGTDVNMMTDMNTMDMNMTDMNMTDMNMTDTNMTDANMTDMNAL